jgi:hypothetical protein
MITNEHIYAFLEVPALRETNDRLNKLREEFVVAVLNADGKAREQMRRQLTERNGFDRLVIEVDNALHTLRAVESSAIDPVVIQAEPRGGRTHNYDFLLSMDTKRGKINVKVELKRGTSIFDQPQFLSLYVNSPGVTSKTTATYAEFFYDKYFVELREKTKCPATTRDDYLRSVFGTAYDSSPFRELYEFAKKNDQARSTLSELQHRSIDEYLRQLIRKPQNIDLDALQDRLNLQLEKVFLCWDGRDESFKWERFNRREITLAGTVSAKSRPNGQLSTVVLPTMTNQEIHMLLRWKNNPCVKGPAWQVRLTRGQT